MRWCVRSANFGIAGGGGRLLRCEASECLRTNDLTLSISIFLRQCSGVASASGARSVSLMDSRDGATTREDPDERRGGRAEALSSLVEISTWLKVSLVSGETLTAVSQRSVNRTCSSRLNCWRLTLSGRSKNHDASEGENWPRSVVRREAHLRSALLRVPAVRGRGISSRVEDDCNGESNHDRFAGFRLRPSAAAC